MAPALPAALMLAFLLFLPGASAQDTGATQVRVEVAPFPSLAQPLQGTVEADVTVETPCAVAGADPAEPRVELWVMDAPAWSRLVLAPSTFAVDPTKCEGGRMAFAATLVGSVDENAPAFAPAPFRLGAAWEGGLVNMTGEGEGAIEAAYFSVLDVVLEASIRTVEPGGTAVFMLKVTNLGNDDTRVLIEADDVPEGFHAVDPAPVVLESRQKGGTAITAQIPLTIQAPGGTGYVNEFGSVHFRLRSENADDAALRGDESTVSVLLTAKGLDAPGPHPALLPLLGVLLALVLRRRAS